MARLRWVEVRHPVELHGVRREAGYRCQYPWNAAKALVAQGKITFVPGPHPGKQEAGYPLSEREKEAGQPDSEDTDTEETETTEPSEFELAVEKLAEVPGIGQSSAEGIAEQLADRDIGVADLLELDDMTEIKGIGEATAEDIREELLSG